MALQPARLRTGKPRFTRLTNTFSKKVENLAHGKELAAVALGRKGGLVGGRARAAKLTPGRWSGIAKKTAAARWKS